MPAYRGYHDISAWRHAQRTDRQRLAAGRASLAALLQTPPRYVEGWCAVCATDTRMRCPAVPTASLRESLGCMRCGANARQRAAAALLLEAVRDGGDVYLSEQAGPFYRALRRRVPRLVGSEFARTLPRRWRLQAGLWRHGVFERLRFADATALPFPDGTFDAAMSLDVLEHVPDFRAALAEFARVLRPGGRLVLTIPFHAGFECSEEVARMLPDGRIEHLQVPEYHGDPLGGGVLCFHHFGWDLLDAMREAGFASAEAVRVRDPAQGLPEPVWVLRATR